MQNRREFIEESRDFWVESAKLDKAQMIGSFVMAAAGIGVAGFGIATALGGDAQTGQVEMFMAASVAAIFTKLGTAEFKGYTAAISKAATRQHQFEQLSQ